MDLEIVIAINKVTDTGNYFLSCLTNGMSYVHIIIYLDWIKIIQYFNYNQYKLLDIHKREKTISNLAPLLNNQIISALEIY
jgi:hypothetical protein